MHASLATLRRAAAGLVAAALPSIAVVPAGCATTAGNGSSGATASAVQHPTLENIPLPSGFALVPERSVGRASGQFRVANCEFVGSLEPEKVNRFYKEYLPSAGFTLKQESFNRGEYALRFDSEAEQCDIRIKRDKFKTVLIVDLGPLPKGSAEREAKPPVRRP